MIVESVIPSPSCLRWIHGSILPPLMRLNITTHEWAETRPNRLYPDFRFVLSIMHQLLIHLRGTANLQSYLTNVIYLQENRIDVPSAQKATHGWR